jgi:hypothetical protein
MRRFTESESARNAVECKVECDPKRNRVTRVQVQGALQRHFIMIRQYHAFSHRNGGTCLPSTGIRDILS